MGIMPFENKKPVNFIVYGFMIFGGDGEIRTLVPVAQQTHFEQ